MTRLPNAFSKKWQNHRASMAGQFEWFNFGQIHMTLRATPTVATGLGTTTVDALGTGGAINTNARATPIFLVFGTA